MENRRSATERGAALAKSAGEFRIGGDLRVTRLGFGAMRITGDGVWGEPSDRAEAIRVFAARYRNHLRSNSGHRLRTSLWFGSKPDESIHALLQFSTEHGQMLGVAVGCGRFFILSIYCPISHRKLVIFGGTD